MPIAGVTIDLTGAISEAAGSLSDIGIAGLLNGTGTFTLATRTVTTKVGDETLTNAGLMTFALTVGALRIGETTGPRLTISAGTLTLAVLKAPQTGFADQRRWLALAGSVTAALEGVTGVTATITDAGLEINTVALDWTTLGVNGITLKDKVTRAKGTLDATLGTAGKLAGSFTYERQGTVTVLGLSGGSVTVGIGSDPHGLRRDRRARPAEHRRRRLPLGQGRRRHRRRRDRRPRAAPRQHHRRRGRPDGRRRGPPVAVHFGDRRGHHVLGLDLRPRARHRGRRHDPRHRHLHERRRSRTARPSRRSPAPA